MAGATPKVSVVVRSYNEERFIRRLFVGLGQQTFKDFEVILVDSGSTDDTVAIAQTFAGKIIHIPKDEFSFGRSLNLGCAAARGEILLIASAHVHPRRTDWIERLLAPFADPAVALVYGKQRGNEITKFSERNLFVRWFPDESDPNQRHHFCNNANCAVRRSVWEVHRYDESLTGLEDLAFAKDLKRRGGAIVYAGDAEVIHVHDESWARVRNRYRREAMALKGIEPSMRFTFFDFLRLATHNIGSDLVAARRQRRLSAEFASIMLFRLNQFWGTYLGYRTVGPITGNLKDRFYFPQAPRQGKGEPGESAGNHEVAKPSVTINYDAIST